MIRLETLRESLFAMGIHHFKVMKSCELKTYGNIYAIRGAKGHLTGLEPPYTDENALLNYMEGFNTLVGMAIPYALLPERKEPLDLHCSRVSIMAWEWDYHQVIKDYIHKLGLPEKSYKLHIDSGPLPERQLALQMGLAQAGRSQMLIHPQLGTGFYLAFMLIQLEASEVSEASEVPVVSEVLEAQEVLVVPVVQEVQEVPELVEGVKASHSLAEICLNCRKCQTHCPSGALFGDHEFDGGKCISALTQFKGHLSPERMKTIGQQLYGCDHCQLSCPANSPLFKTFNTGAASGQESGAKERLLLKRDQHNAINPENLLYLSQKAFKQSYGHMGFSWRGVKTNKRNALINMGNSGDPYWKSVLIQFLERKEPLDEVLLQTANWALQRLEELSKEKDGLT